MKAVVLDQWGSLEDLHLTEIADPVPLPNEVLVEVHAAGVNPVDAKIVEGMLQGRLPHAFPLIPGWEMAGVVIQTGKNVSDWHVGDEVYAYCRKSTVQWGCYAEKVCVDATHVAKKPVNLSMEEAAAIPLTGLTAWQSILDMAGLKKGQTLLIQGGAGGVGGMAIQLARNAGAQVMTTARAVHHDYVQRLGANRVVDYSREDVAACVKESFPLGADVVFDCVGGETFRNSLAYVKKGGYLVSILEKGDEVVAKKMDIHLGYVFVSPNGGELRQLAALFEENKLKSPALTVLPLGDAVKALKQIKTGHTQGKLVLKVI